jgi:hypothetical protein
MLRFFMMTFSLLTVITVNVAANIMSLNGSTTVEIANKLPVLFIPKGYVFSIWVVIYLLLAVWLYDFWHNHKTVNKNEYNIRTLLFLLSCLFNISWIVLWHYEFFIWTILLKAALLATLIGLYFSYPKKDNRFVGRIPISIYLGWTIVMFIANVSYVLTLHEWGGWGLSNPLWTVIYLTFSTAIALHFLYHYRDIAINVVIMWTFIGITVKNGLEELFVSAVALFLTAVVLVCIFIFNKKRAKV